MHLAWGGFTTCESAGWFFKALQGGYAGCCSVWSLQKRLDLSDSFLNSLKRRPISWTKVTPCRTARPSERWHIELTSKALTMFLKWALRVPVVWWYSITQLLFRISPLLSLWQRSSTGVTSFRIMKAFKFTHLVQCHNNIIPSINLMGKQAEGQWWGTADEDYALHSLDCSTLPAWLTCRLRGFSVWGGCGSTPQIPKHWSSFSHVSELDSCPKPRILYLLNDDNKKSSEYYKSACKNCISFMLYINSLYSKKKQLLDALNLLPCVLVFQQGLGLLFTNNGGFDLWGVHVHIQFATN